MRRRCGSGSLAAMIDCRGLGAMRPSEIRWHSDLDGELGVGYDLVAYLRDGRHSITVTAPDGRGGSVSEHGIFIRVRTPRWHRRPDAALTRRPRPFGRVK